MKEVIVGLLILLFSCSNVFAFTARSEVESVVFGSSNVQVHSVAETEVNGKKIRVESDQPGSIELEMKNDQAEIKTSRGLTPTVFISDEEIKPTIFQSEVEEVSLETKPPKKILSFFENLWQRILAVVFDFTKQS